MRTSSKIEQVNPEFNIRKKYFSSFIRRAPNEPIIKTTLFFLAVFLLITYYYVSPKTSAVMNFLETMNSGNTDKISQLATECTLYSNESLNKALKKEYINQLSYIIQISRLNRTNNFYINPIGNDSFLCDLNTNGSYGSLTKDLYFIKDKESFKLDTNSYIRNNCTGSLKNKTVLENKLLIRQLLYCYQYYMDEYVNKGNTFVFKFIEKDSSLYNQSAEYIINNLDLRQSTAFIEFKNIKFNGNSAVIDVYETERQDKSKIISLRKHNYSYKAVNVNGRWLLNHISLQN